PAITAALLLGLFNAFLRPVLVLLTFPLTLITFGLFLLVLNGLLLKLAAFFIKGFEVHGFWSAVFGAFLISIISGLLNIFVNDRSRVKVIVMKR
ncbi:MAG: phage holin family protein, partial [Candidatus Methylomirabilales bacterium]